MSTRRKIAYAFLVLVAIIALIITVIAYELGSPAREVAKNTFMHSIRKQTNQWDTRVDLIPKPLSYGMNFSDVEARLLSSDFVLRADRKYMRRQPSSQEPFSASEASYKKENEIVFSIDHGDYVCSKEYVVFLLFNKSNQLTSAQGMIGERGCL